MPAAARARRVERVAGTSAAADRTVSAREGCLGASNYHRLSEFHLRADPRRDARVLAASRAADSTFAHAAAPLRPDGEAVVTAWAVCSLPEPPLPSTASLH